MNFTAHYLVKTKRILRDEFGNGIDSFLVAKAPINPIFQKPHLVVEIFNRSEEESSDNKVEVINSVLELQNLGFYVCEIPLPKQMAWFPKQTKFFRIIRTSSPEAMNYKKRRAMPAYRDEKHFVEYDKKNKIVRLVGSLTSPSGFGPWEEIR